MRQSHPPTHSALRAGPRCWRSSEYRASPAPRFNSEGRGRGDQGGGAGAVLVPHADPHESSLHTDSTTNTTAPASAPRFYLTRDWQGSVLRALSVTSPGAERGMGGSGSGA